MKKVLDKQLENKLAEIMKSDEAQTAVAILRELQDASGLKICQTASQEDAAYREVK